jgi:eukaryotic-like serine/threonine-protein kinase
MISRCPHPSIRPRSGASPRSAGVARGDTGVLLAGRYRLGELAGHGATAMVWRAHDGLLDREVAVKQFRCRQPHDVAEAHMAARVRHPNVAAVHDMVTHRGSYCLVMDYHEGGTLAKLLRRGRSLPARVAAPLGLQLLAALQAVHAAGIVHCDVKPANLLLGGDGRLVLIDFGIAESSDGRHSHPARRNGDVVGSPPYMAPELVRGEAPSPAADLWSLGATVYAAVEGRPPFQEDDAASTLAAVLHDPPAPTRRAGRLRPLLDRLLVKDPAERPSCEAVREMLAGAYPTARAAMHETGPGPAGPIEADVRVVASDPGPADCWDETLPVDPPGNLLAVRRGRALPPARPDPDRGPRIGAGG